MNIRHCEGGNGGALAARIHASPGVRRPKGRTPMQVSKRFSSLFSPQPIRNSEVVSAPY
jgi:hypothetical protein